MLDLISKGFSEKVIKKICTSFTSQFLTQGITQRGRNVTFSVAHVRRVDSKGTRQLNCSRQHALKRGYLKLEIISFYVPSETEFTWRTHGQNINKFIDSTMCTEQVLEDSTVDSFSPCYWSVNQQTKWKRLLFFWYLSTVVFHFVREVIFTYIAAVEYMDKSITQDSVVLIATLVVVSISRGKPTKSVLKLSEK